MTRIACALILAGMAPVLWVVLDTNGPNAVWFTFLGTPLVAAGIAVAALAYWRNRGGST